MHRRAGPPTTKHWVVGGLALGTRPSSLAPNGGDGYAPAGACHMMMKMMSIVVSTVQSICFSFSRNSTGRLRIPSRGPAAQKLLLLISYPADDRKLSCREHKTTLANLLKAVQ